MSCHILPSRVLRLLCSATALRLPSDGLDSFQARSSDTVLTVSELGLSDAAVMISLGFGVWVGRAQGSGAISRHAMPRARARCGIAAAVLFGTWVTLYECCYLKVWGFSCCVLLISSLSQL